jgi:hypothetical protein
LEAKIAYSIADPNVTSASEPKQDVYRVSEAVAYLVPKADAD